MTFFFRINLICFFSFGNYFFSVLRCKINCTYPGADALVTIISMMTTEQTNTTLLVNNNSNSVPRRYCAIEGQTALGNEPGVQVSIEFAERHLESTKQCCRGKASMINDLRESCIGTEYGDALAKWTTLTTTKEDVVGCKKGETVERERIDAQVHRWAAERVANEKATQAAAYERSRKNPLDAYMYDFMQWYESSERREYEAAEARLLRAEKRANVKMPVVATRMTRHTAEQDGRIQQQETKEVKEKTAPMPLKTVIEQQETKKESKMRFIGSSVIPTGASSILKKQSEDNEQSDYKHVSQVPEWNSRVAAATAPSVAAAKQPFDAVDIVTTTYLGSKQQPPVAQRVVGGFHWSFLH